MIFLGFSCSVCNEATLKTGICRSRRAENSSKLHRAILIELVIEHDKFKLSCIVHNRDRAGPQ